MRTQHKPDQDRPSQEALYPKDAGTTTAGQDALGRTAGSGTHATDAVVDMERTRALGCSEAEELQHSGQSSKRGSREEGGSHASKYRRTKDAHKDTHSVTSGGPLVPRGYAEGRNSRLGGSVVPRGGTSVFTGRSEGSVVPQDGPSALGKMCEGPLVPLVGTARREISSGGSVVPRSEDAGFGGRSEDFAFPQDGTTTLCKSSEGLPVPQRDAARHDTSSGGSVVPRSAMARSDKRVEGSVVPREKVTDQIAFPIAGVRGQGNNVFPFVNVEVLGHLLQGYDEEKTAYIVEGFQKGFSIGCVAPQPGYCKDNLSSCYAAPEVIDNYIQEEQAMGRIIGPFETSPFPSTKISPVGLIPKAVPGEYRVIHHLSHPSGSSINDSIPREHVQVSYGSVDDAIEVILSHNFPVFMAKTDIRCAYRIVPIRASERGLLGFRWKGKLYFDCALPMGSASSAQIFQTISDALVWIAKRQFGCVSIINVLDDFLFIEKNVESCKIALGSFVRMCEMCRIPLKLSKTVNPCTAIEFLGLQLDSVRKEVILPAAKVSALRTEVQTAKDSSSLTLRAMQSLIGKLNFACLAVPIGRPFLRRLIDTTRGTLQPWRRILTTGQARRDMEAWLAFLSSFNGRSMMTQRVWDPSRLVCLYTDASGVIGFGATLGSRWLYGQWPWPLENSSIAVKEMVPIVLACQAWFTQLEGKSVKVVSDNMSVVCAINAKSCRDPCLMAWVRRFFVICIKGSIHVFAEHIPSKSNACADALSRGLLQRFKELRPAADPNPTDWSWDDFRDLL